MIEELVAYLGRDVEPAQARQVLTMATEYVRAYTRGRGFHPDDGVRQPYPDVEAVILSVAARLLASPDGATSINQTVGPFTQQRSYPQFGGLNLMEQAVLHRYRVRAQ